MLTTMWTKCALSFATVVATSSFANADVWTVDDSGGFDFTDIQSAIAAAADGDTILVRPGNYTDFLIEDKTLNVFAETASVNIVGTVYVSNLSKHKRVVLSGLSITGRQLWPASDLALAMNVNVGAIRIDSCTISGGAGLPPMFPEDDDPYGSGGGAVDLFYCTDLAFTGCTIQGGDGAGTPDHYYFGDGGDGGDGVNARASAVALYDCVVRGGIGAPTPFRGGDGGTAYHCPTGGFFASGSSFTGGRGGNSWDCTVVTPAGNGGHGIFVGANANAHLLDNTYVGGSKGFSCSGPNGTPGAGISGTGYIEQLSGMRRQFTAQRIAAPSSQLVVTVTGQPGDQVFLPWSGKSAWRYRPANAGTWLIPYPARMTAQPIGVIGASGTLTTQIPLAALPAGSEAELTCVQGFVIDTLGKSFIGRPMHVLRK